MSNRQLTAVIFAGGASRRMGTDKAALEIGGMTLLERTVRLALSADLPPLIVGRPRPDEWPLESVVFAEDSLPGHGPLGGLTTALRLTPKSVLTLACDLPLLTADALRWLAAEAASSATRDGVVTVNGEGWEPLFSVYRQAALPQAEARLAAGRRSLHGLIESAEFAFVHAPAWVSAQLVNVNTSEDWERVRKISLPGTI